MSQRIFIFSLAGHAYPVHEYPLSDQEQLLPFSSQIPHSVGMSLFSSIFAVILKVTSKSPRLQDTLTLLLRAAWLVLLGILVELISPLFRKPSLAPLLISCPGQLPQDHSPTAGQVSPDLTNSLPPGKLLFPSYLHSFLLRGTSTFPLNPYPT